jgi:hypothetical protein
MLTSRYDLYIGIGIGAVSVIILILIATTIFCKCCIPSPTHRYFGRPVSNYAAINSIDAKTYFKPPQHLVSSFHFFFVLCLTVCLLGHDLVCFRF